MKLKKIDILKFIKMSEEYESDYENIIENNSEADLNTLSTLYRNNNGIYYNNIDQTQASNNKTKKYNTTSIKINR